MKYLAIPFLIMFLISSMIISIASLEYGCSSILCFYQTKINTITNGSSYNLATCEEIVCIVYDADRNCVATATCLVDCSYWSTVLVYSGGTCTIRDGPFDQNITLTVYLDIRDNSCNDDIDRIESDITVGAIFAMLSFLFAIILCLLCFCYCNEKKKAKSELPEKEEEVDFQEYQEVKTEIQ